MAPGRRRSVQRGPAPPPGADTSRVTLTALEGRRVLLTGASGFIGSHVAAQLVQEGAQVVATVSGPASRVPARLTPLAGRIRLVHGDLVENASLAEAVGGAHAELVVHLAAFTHVGKSFARLQENIRTNVEGTVNLLAALDGHYERLVYVSTADVYGDAPVPFHEDGPIRPASPYAVSKYAAERFCRMFHQAYGWPIVCLRPFNAYGPGQSVDRIIPELIAAALNGRPLAMTEGRQTRDFTYVTDVANAICRALVAPRLEGEVINIGRGDDVAIRDLALLVLRQLGITEPPRFGALPYRPNEIWHMVGDVSRARRLLDWKPHVDLDDGLRSTIAWFRDAGPQRW